MPCGLSKNSWLRKQKRPIALQTLTVREVDKLRKNNLATNDPYIYVNKEEYGLGIG